jgi:glycosyltransferase involved in cell wall biosynthesis
VIVYIREEESTVKIAQVAPLFESVPSIGYGGTERAVSYLTEELVALGHDVTLFASGDSNTAAKLVPLCDQSLRSTGTEAEHNAYMYAGLENIFRQQNDFDVIHFHTGYLAFPYVRRGRVATVTTLHGRLDIPGMDRIVGEYSDIPLIAISKAQTVPAPDLNWVDTIGHGLPHNLYDFRPTPGDYLCFVGRIAQEKGIEEAMAIANRTGMKLKIAAKVDPTDRAYYETTIKPIMDASPNIEFLWEIGEPEKNELMGNALALLFPTLCNESFGLAMIESMACGTPVIAFNNGAVPEVMNDGVTGFICDNVDEAVSKMHLLASLDRAVIRQEFETRFSVRAIASEYVRVYQRLKAEKDLVNANVRPARFRATLALPTPPVHIDWAERFDRDGRLERIERYA